MIDAFIPNDLAVAPNPLGRTPNLKLTTIPIDAYFCFELWMPTGNGVLLPEEGMILKGDRSRLEEICARLIWLLGARPLEGGLPVEQPLVHDWVTLKNALAQKGTEFEAIGLSYQPQTLYSHTNPDSIYATWTLQPAHWKILPLTFNPTGKGVQVEVGSTQILLTLGERIIRPERSPAIATN